ncbi:hypothetical protein P280DRAFT_465942 [Massarina eburnea CBS 473.64]|uniref:Mid2 domain-containing protein n=1 Tax=Massarina eburnea CBS 473.64 TaxID=1395130 RepID=A0A6A6SE21_9PLEO|nr:hypothetical protein P280DRAFT_465942 [Massarina eburnea CBS 473.64]
MPPRSILFPFLSFLTPTLAAADCFFANGTVLPTTQAFFSTIQPCVDDPVKTICCNLGRDNEPGGDYVNGYTNDECLPNGLCQNRLVKNGTKTTNYWLEYCTDKDVTSGKCLDVCRETRNDAGGTLMTPCDGTNNSTKWCCGGSTTCCTNDYGVVQLPRQFSGKAISSGVVSLSSASTPSPAPSQSLPAERKGSELSSGTKAGIGIGVVFGLLVLVGAIFFVVKALAWRRKANLQESEGLKYGDTFDKYIYAHGGYQISELSDHTEPVELENTPRPVELSNAQSLQSSLRSEMK